MATAKSRKPMQAPSLRESSNILLVLREGALIALLAVATYFLMALLSYSAQDPSWSAVGDHGAINNTAGAHNAAAGTPAMTRPIADIID